MQRKDCYDIITRGNAREWKRCELTCVVKSIWELTIIPVLISVSMYIFSWNFQLQNKGLLHVMR